ERLPLADKIRPNCKVGIRFTPDRRAWRSTGPTYEMIGGLERQIREIKEVVELPILHPELFTSLGISQPKGVLLYGPPGTGKTMLARAVAHHTKCAFFKLSGTELVQKYIGEGARLMRELFIILARQKAPSIINFWTSIGTKRSDGGGGSHSSGGGSSCERTMIELLNQVDGFEPAENIKPSLATGSHLIPAQAGWTARFSYPPPNLDGRVDILRIHSRRMNLGRGVCLRAVAERMHGASGAELKLICQEAAFSALREGRQFVTQEDFLQRIDKVMKSLSARDEYQHATKAREPAEQQSQPAGAEKAEFPLYAVEADEGKLKATAGRPGLRVHPHFVRTGAAKKSQKPKTRARDGGGGKNSLGFAAPINQSGRPKACWFMRLLWLPLAANSSATLSDSHDSQQRLSEPLKRLSATLSDSQRFSTLSDSQRLSATLDLQRPLKRLSRTLSGSQRLYGSSAGQVWRNLSSQSRRRRNSMRSSRAGGTRTAAPDVSELGRQTGSAGQEASFGKCLRLFRADERSSFELLLTSRAEIFYPAAFANLSGAHHRYNWRNGSSFPGTHLGAGSSSEFFSKSKSRIQKYVFCLTASSGLSRFGMAGLEIVDCRHEVPCRGTVRCELLIKELNLIGVFISHRVLLHSKEASLLLFDKKIADKLAQAQAKGNCVGDSASRSFATWSGSSTRNCWQIWHPAEDCSDSLGFATEPIWGSLANFLGKCDRISSSVPAEIKKVDHGNVKPCSIPHHKPRMLETLRPGRFVEKSSTLHVCHAFPEAYHFTSGPRNAARRWHSPILTTCARLPDLTQGTQACDIFSRASSFTPSSNGGVSLCWTLGAAASSSHRKVEEPASDSMPKALTQPLRSLFRTGGEDAGQGAPTGLLARSCS
uniref:AAA domain-containing protein n=1 Tax=Macrostomum lignano TaxID=282301 RepID=A0A1I8FQ25_9PLAT